MPGPFVVKGSSKVSSEGRAGARKVLRKKRHRHVYQGMEGMDDIHRKGMKGILEIVRRVKGFTRFGNSVVR